MTLLFSATYFNLLQKNNNSVPAPSKQEIQSALNDSINWVLEHQDELINIDNPILWWFLDESAILTKNNQLANLTAKYKNTVLDRNSVWAGYWVKKPSFYYAPGSLDYMANYQKFFAFGLSCDADLAEEPVIQEQFSSHFCDWRPYYSSCTTHQLMAIRSLQIKDCGDQTLNQELSAALADQIQQQLVWDPRVGDVYIQRALMLVESGNENKVKPVWIQNILNEQLDSGAWASFYKLLHLYDDKYFGFSYMFVDVRTPESNFHTTAQAIYLLSLLLNE